MTESEGSSKPARRISFKADVEWMDDPSPADKPSSDPSLKDSKTLSLGDVRDTYFQASQKVSEILRQYALAGIALIWVFKGSGANAFGLDTKLLKASLWIIGAIGADFLQYVATSYIWFGYFRSKEKKDKNLDQQFTVSRYINLPNQILFAVKIAALFTAYVFYILPYVWWRVHH
jgi:hypothetical protein